MAEARRESWTRFQSPRDADAGNKVERVKKVVLNRPGSVPDVSQAPDKKTASKGEKLSKADSSVKKTPSTTFAAPPQATAASMASAKPSRKAFRSKYSGKPGSRHALYVNFENDTNAYTRQDIPKDAYDTKISVLKTLEPRLGVRREWNASTQTEEPSKFTIMQHSISEFQSIKLPYSYRSEKIPDVYKKTLYVAKGNKFKFDQKLLLPEKDRNRLRSTNVTINSSAEHKVHDKLDQKKEWNVSTYFEERDFNAWDSKRKKEAVSNSLSRTAQLTTQRPSLLQRYEERRSQQRDLAETQMREAMKFSGPSVTPSRMSMSRTEDDSYTGSRSLSPSPSQSSTVYQTGLNSTVSADVIHSILARSSSPTTRTKGGRRFGGSYAEDSDSDESMGSPPASP